MTLDSRGEVLLKALVERYISEGLPVGSRTLAKHSGLDISPATIRNVMVDLEERGLVRSPHTSAGRVPTDLGYRLFVDTLLTVKPLETEQVRQVASDLTQEQTPEQLVASASLVLSQLTGLAGIVRAPRRDQATFRHLEFLALSGQRVLAILVTQDGRVQNRILTMDRAYSAAELLQASNYFNDTYPGLALADVRAKLLAALGRDSERMQAMLRSAVQMAATVLEEDEETEAQVVVAGEANLFGVPDLDAARLRQLFDAFSTKRDLLALLDGSMRTTGMHIFIGSESGHEALNECSLVTAPYHVDGRVIGTLAVIGPTRMPYETIISIVDITAQLLGQALSGESSSRTAPVGP